MKQTVIAIAVLAIVCIGLIVVCVHPSLFRPSRDPNSASTQAGEQYDEEMSDASAEFKARTDGFREVAGDKLLQVVRAGMPQTEVERLLGRPNSISSLPEGESWMYVTGYSKAIFVVFDSNDNVRAVDRLPKKS